MGRKKKGALPSGSIRIQKCVGRTADGKRIMKSFTAETRDKAEQLYRHWLVSGDPDPRQQSEAGGAMTVSMAVEKYTDSKRQVLSPATVRCYESIWKTHIDDTALGRLPLDQLTVTAVQVWISELAAVLKPKTVRNASTLLRSSVEMFSPGFRWSVTLPQKIPPDLYCPSDADVRILLNAVHGKDPEMERAIYLAAFGPLRRSEICALTRDDIRGSAVVVSKAMVNGDSGWTVKTTKTVSSNRVVELPEAVLAALRKADGRMVSCNPDALSNRFKRLVVRLKLPHIRFHDLRHYSASIMHAIGVPDQYIMARGGWSSDAVMKRVYRNVIGIEQKKQSDRIKKHFASVVG